MATVFVTFFLIIQIHVYEMDADYTKRRRVSEKSLREKRWSMNSQRLEVIVAELMKPISDVRRSFDTDLSALLEEYLTEAGLRALDEGEEGGEGELGDATPNFAELALLLQQSASIYSRKVDFLYQHVLDVSDSLHTSTQEAPLAPEEPQTPSGRRKRRGSAGAGAGAGEFSVIEVCASACARRETGARPPPTLPRGLLELEPRVLTAADAPLLDYAGEPVGLLADFQVAWRLQDGLLVDELQTAVGEAGGEGAGGGRLRAVPLTELQAAIEAAAPPDLPPPPPSPDLPDMPHETEVEPESEPQPLVVLEPQPQPLACSSPLERCKRERKRRSDVRLEELAGIGKILISEEGRRRLARPQEFSVPPQWVARVVAARSERVLAARRRLREHPPPPEFRGFDGTAPTDIGGFAGWSAVEAACAADAAGLGRRPRADSDDDGFFDQSSTGDSDDSAAALTTLATLSTLTTLTTLTTLNTTPVIADPPAEGGAEGGPEWVSWRDGVVARAAAAAAHGFSDVRAAGADVLRAARGLADGQPLQPLQPLVPCDALLAATSQSPTDVSRKFLATLFLANAGQLQLVPGAPLTLNSFSVLLPSAAGPPAPPAPPPR